MIRLLWFAWGTLCMTAVAPATAQQACYGPGDVNADGLVTFDDLALFAGCMAGPEVGQPPGCDPATWGRADLDDDGDVDLPDFAALACRAGSTYFDYGPHRENLEAEMLAMALTGELRAADAQYARILRDLALIRTTYPQLVSVIDDPDYVPNELIVKLVAGQPLDGYHALNAYYLLTAEEHLFGDWWVLTFCDNLNAVTLGPIYVALPEVQYADPNYLIGTDDQITVQVLSGTYRYSIDDGFWDCFDGCDCHRYWVIDVDALGTVTLVSYEEYGMSWCEFD
jgi:hypothetical protein